MELAQSTDKTFSIEEVSGLSGVSRRTIRYYIELGLVERPIGETRAAYYTWRHLQQLLEIRRLSESGLSLEAVRRRLAATQTEAVGDVPGTYGAAAPFSPSIEVRSHLQLAPGVELVVEPGTARLSPEQLRRLMRETLAALDRVRQENTDE
jgi:DNA-binding transcriptional MerR regulator